MNKLLVVFFTGLAVASAQSVFDPLEKLFKNNPNPTIPQLNAALAECLAYLRNDYSTKTMELSDITTTSYAERGQRIKLILTNGEMFGFETMYQKEDATLDTYSTFHYKTTLYGYENITAKYNYEAKHKGQVSRGTVIAATTEFELYVEFRFDIPTWKVTLNKLEARKTLPFTITLVGEPEDDLLKANTAVFEELIQEAISKAILQYVQTEATGSNS